MGRVLLRKRTPSRKDRFVSFPRAYVLARSHPPNWNLWTTGMRAAWKNRPRDMLAPDLDLSFSPKRLCFDCERPQRVIEYCDGNWEIIKEPCRFHRFAPDSALVSAGDHPTLPILFPAMNKVTTHHVGNCILPDNPIVSGQKSLAESIYFLRCTGTHVNSIGEAIKVNRASRRVKVGDIKGVPVVRTTKPSAAEIPEIVPFKMRYVMAVLKGWGLDNETMKDIVRDRMDKEDAKCSSGGRGVQAGQVTPMGPTVT